MADNKLADLSTEFAVQILKLTDSMKGHYSLANQLERSGTSIGANIHEANYAHGKPDFIAELQITPNEKPRASEAFSMKSPSARADEGIKTLRRLRRSRGADWKVRDF